MERLTKKRIKEAKRFLKGYPTSELKNLFYQYAQSAPIWADDLMDIVPENKLRRFLIEKIEGILSDEELVEEMGA